MSVRVQTGPCPRYIQRGRETEEGKRSRATVCTEGRPGPKEGKWMLLQAVKHATLLHHKHKLDTRCLRVILRIWYFPRKVGGASGTKSSQVFWPCTGPTAYIIWCVLTIRQHETWLIVVTAVVRTVFMQFPRVHGICTESYLVNTVLYIHPSICKCIEYDNCMSNSSACVCVLYKRLVLFWRRRWVHLIICHHCLLNFFLIILLILKRTKDQ